MKSHTKQQGSTAHIVIITILVVAVLGLLGFVFWQNFIKDSQSKTNATQTTKTEEKSTDTSTKEEPVTAPSGWVSLKDTENKISYYLPEGESVTIKAYPVGEKIHVGYGAPVFVVYDGNVWQTYDNDQNNEPTILRSESIVTPLELRAEGLYKTATYTTGDGLASEKRLLIVDTRYIWEVYYQFSFSNKGTSEGFIENFIKSLNFDEV